MRPHLLSLVLLLAATASVPLVSAICISRFEKSESKSEAHGAAATNGGSVKTLSLDEYGLPKKVAEKPKEVNPYEEAASAKASTAYDKPLEEDKESSAPKKVKKEKSDDSDGSTYIKKEKKEKSGDSEKKKEKRKFVDFDVSGSTKKEKKEKSDDSDGSTYLNIKKENKEKSGDSDKEKKKFVDFDVSGSTKKEKKEKSDDSDESSSPKKKKKEKSDGSNEYEVSHKKEKKEKKSDDDSDQDASSAAKKEKKKKKAIESDASAYFKKEKKAEKKSKKKDKSNDSSENEEKSDDDAAPVDVSASGQYVSPSEAKAEEDTTPADASSVPTELSPAAKGYADEYASQKTSQQPIMGGSPDELPPSATKQSSTAASSNQQPMGGAPDELPPSATKSSGGDPYSGMPSDPKKPKLSTESFGGNLNTIRIKKPAFPHPHMPVSPVTKSVCANTGYPEDCEESIAELPGGAGEQPAADPVAVLRLAMEAVREKAIVAMNAATDRMNAAGTEPVVKEALNTCTSSYSDIKSNLELVDQALKRGDLATARTNLDSVETDVTTCDDGFAERGTPSVMTDHDQELQKLASDLIAIGANSISHA